MDKLSNDTIGLIFGYLDYKDCKNVESSKCLPACYYKDTNKKYMINKMKQQIQCTEKLKRNIKKHPLIMCCSGVNCNEVGVLNEEEDMGCSINQKLTRCCNCEEDYCESCNNKEPKMIYCVECTQSACVDCGAGRCDICHDSFCNNCPSTKDYLVPCSFCDNYACYDPGNESNKCMKNIEFDDSAIFICKHCVIKQYKKI